MSLKDEIHELFCVKESHELPTAVMDTIMDPDELSKRIIDYQEMFPDLKQDILRDYFQECSADRKNFMQDYTPDGICQIVAGITGKQSTIADLCAGTGSLTIAAWIRNPDAEFTCYELSTAAIPLLLFNLAVRKIKAKVIAGDVLAQDYTVVYQVEAGRVICSEADFMSTPELFDAVITNPPYSLKWSGVADQRMAGFPAAPKSKADLAFVLIGLSMLKPDGRLVGILPHGVLFRGAAEAEIRKRMLERHLIDSVIGLAPALFANTTIPVVLLILKKGRQKDEPVLITNAEKLMIKRPKQNTLSPGHVARILEVYRDRKPAERLSDLVSMEKIQANDFNLNLPRYVDTSEPDPPVGGAVIAKKLAEIRAQEAQIMRDLKQQLYQLHGTSEEAEKRLNAFRREMELWML